MGLKTFAWLYCKFVSPYFHLFGGIEGYQIFLLCIWLVFLSTLAYLSRRPGGPATKWLFAPWAYGLLLIIALFSARLPTLIPGEFNPDESLFLAGAIKLRHYPIFWDSVDSSTSGPFNYYPLVILNLLGLPLDYSTARLLNILCTGGSIVIAYQIARPFMPDHWARLTALPPLAALMLFRGFDFIHYSSECVPVFLIALSTWLLLSSERSPSGHPLRYLAVGVLIIVVPLTKLQAAPVMLAIAVLALVSIFRKRGGNRRLPVLYLGAGAMATALIVLVYLATFGVLDRFVQSYIRNNLLYANGLNGIPDSLRETVRIFLWVPDVHWSGMGMIACVVFAGYYCRSWRQQPWRSLVESLRDSVAIGLALVLVWWLIGGGSGLSWALLPLSLLAGITLFGVAILKEKSGAPGSPSFKGILTFSILIASVYCVLKPNRAFGHYLVFLVFPFTLAGVWAIGRALAPVRSLNVKNSERRELRIAAIFVLFTVALPVYLRSQDIGTQSEEWMLASGKDAKCEPCRLISQFATPGSLAFVWGWGSKYYVLTGTVPATREPDSVRMIGGGPQQAYYLQQFMKELQQHSPSVFVDAVGPQQFNFQNRELAGHQIFPEVREYVNRNFYLAGDIEGVRVYAPTSGSRDARISNVPESSAGAPIADVRWQAEPTWLPNSQGPEAGTLSAGSAWSSYGGSDSKTGLLTISRMSPNPKGCFVVPVSHGPSIGGQNVNLVSANGDIIGRIDLDSGKPQWQFMELRYDSVRFPAVQIVAADLGSGYGQWLAVGQPRSCGRP